jgi:hypothetical protein
MVFAVDFSGLHAWAQAAASILLLELCVLLLMMVALMGLLLFAARWLQMQVVPLLNRTVPAANQALEVANEGSERVVRGVAEVYGVRRAIETGLRVMLFGHDTSNPLIDMPRAGSAPTANATPADTREMAEGAPAAARTPRATEPRVARTQRASSSTRAPDRGVDDMAAHAG